MMKILNKFEYIIKTSKIYNINATIVIIKEKREKKNLPHDNKFHLLEAIHWLKRAQDASPDGGVSRAYSIAWHPYYKRKGWQKPYPETTGYIIPTFFDCANYFNDKDLFDRAVKMAQWEIDIQMKNGAVRGGVVDDGESVPAVFCTGQVILGWIRAYKETEDISFLKAAQIGGDYLIGVQNNEGRFIEDKKYPYANKISTAYHTRVAWSLILLGKITGNDQYIKAGKKNIEFGMALQKKNGWFENNCLTDAENPLLHTICYAVRGILEASFLLDNDRYLNASILTADYLVSVIEKNEYLPGRLDKNWESSESWSCLTGNAQLIIILLKLYQKTQNHDYLNAAQKVLQFLNRIHDINSSNLGLRGGIKGSFPVNGPYGCFEVLNWATKFYIDALILENQIANIL